MATTAAATSQTGTFWPAGGESSEQQLSATLGPHEAWQLDRDQERPVGLRELFEQVTEWQASQQRLATLPSLWHDILDNQGPMTLQGVEWDTSTRATVHSVTTGHHLESQVFTSVEWHVLGAQLDAFTASVPAGILKLHGDRLRCDFTQSRTWEATRLFAHQVTRLWEVATGMEVLPVQLRISADHGTTWSTVWDLPQEREAAERMARRSGDLLHCHHVRAEWVGAWASQCQTWGPVTAMARSLPEIPIEVQVLVYAAGLEGLHRRTLGATTERTMSHREPNTPKPSLIQGLSAKALSAARKAVVQAATDCLQDIDIDPGTIDLVEKRIRDSLTYIDQPSFRERLVELLGPVEPLAPGLLGPSLSDWAVGLAKVRNNEAHQLVESGIIGPDEVTLYLGYHITARWALRLALLRHVMDGGVLHAHLNNWALRRDLQKLDLYGFYPRTNSTFCTYSAAAHFDASFE